MAYAPSSINFEAIRVSLLDDTGAPDPDSAGLYVSDNGISAAVTFQNEDGPTVRRRKGNGAICLNTKGRTAQVSSQVTLQHCVWPFEATKLLLGAYVAYDGPDAIGYALPSPSELAQRRFCLEAWSLAYNSEVRTDVEGDPGLLHHIWPQCTAVQDGFTLNNEDAPFGIVVTGLPNSNMPDGGPFGDWPHFDSGSILNSNTPQGVYAVFIDTNLPAALEDLQALAAVS